MIFWVLKGVLCLAESWAGLSSCLGNDGPHFDQVCEIMGHIFSNMCGIMGPNFEPKMARHRPTLGLVTPPPRAPGLILLCCSAALHSTLYEWEALRIDNVVPY